MQCRRRTPGGRRLKGRDRSPSPGAPTKLWLGTKVPEQPALNTHVQLPISALACLLGPGLRPTAAAGCPGEGASARVPRRGCGLRAHSAPSISHPNPAIKGSPSDALNPESHTGVGLHLASPSPPVTVTRARAGVGAVGESGGRVGMGLAAPRKPRAVLQVLPAAPRSRGRCHRVCPEGAQAGTCPESEQVDSLQWEAGDDRRASQPHPARLWGREARREEGGRDELQEDTGPRDPGILEHAFHA
ncbi:uncharacterized protein LOC144337477 [Macaca mulatta]